MFCVGVMVADVKAILIVVIVINDASLEVVAAGWGDCRVACAGGRGLRSGQGQRNGEEGRDGGG